MKTTWKSTALIISSMIDLFDSIVFGVGIFTWQIVQCLLPVAVALFQTSIKRRKNLIKWKPANPKMGRVIHEAKKAKSIRKNWLTEYNTNDITSGILYHMMNTLICPLFLKYQFLYQFLKKCDWQKVFNVSSAALWMQGSQPWQLKQFLLNLFCSLLFAFLWFEMMPQQVRLWIGTKNVLHFQLLCAENITAWMQNLRKTSPHPSVHLHRAPSLNKGRKSGWW